MKIKLENREFELKANGSFMKKYQESFEGNVIKALYKSIQEKDIMVCAQLCYCAIDEELPPFEEWIDTFETPLFVFPEMDNILNYLIRSVQPSVEPKEDKQAEGKSETKKKTN